MKLPVNYNDIQYPKRREVRNAYINLQGGKCHHCDTPLTHAPADKVQKLPVNKKLFPKGFFTWPVHLHHDHKTGMTIGAVHSYCNAVLWQYHGE